MFSSSFEYFKALRENDLLRFLEWPAFITSKYTEEGKVFGSDELMNCLIYEWIIQGYLPLDDEKIAILYAIYERDPSPLHAGKYAFPLISVTSALFACKAYHLHGLDKFIVPKTKMSAKKLSAFMEEQEGEHASILKQSMSMFRDEFIKQIPLVEKKKVNFAYKKISDMTQYIVVLEKYIDYLSLAEEQEINKKLYKTRLGTVKSLYSYLLKQSELTEEVVQEMKIYVNTIRRQQPATWEEEYLHQISPFTLVEKTWNTFAYVSSTFFNKVLPRENLEGKSNVELVNDYLRH